jgi:lysophospholipase L1-like esterase
MKKLILLGDSLFAYLTKSSVQKLEELAGDIDVYNCATGGWDSNDVLRKAPYIAELKPDVVAISLGTNDASPWKKVEVDVYERNLSKIFKLFSDSKIVIFPPPPINEAKHPEDRKRTNEQVKRYYDAVLRAINGTNCVLLDSWGIFMPLQADGDDYHIEDGVHLNEMGTQLLITKLAAAI